MSIGIKMMEVLLINYFTVSTCALSAREKLDCYQQI